MTRALSLAFVACALLAAASPAGARKSAPPSTGLRGIQLGRPAPDFTFADGEGLHRLSELSGKVVVVHFWAAWCKPCLDEMPALERLYVEYGGKVAIVAMNWHDPVDGRSFAAAQGWSLPIADDPGARAAGAFAIVEVPTTLILLGDGTVSYVSVGEASWDELSGALTRALTPATRV